MVAMQTVLGWTARGRWLEYGQASAGKRAAFPEDRKQRRQREAGRKKGNGKGEDGKEAQGTPGEERRILVREKEAFGKERGNLH